MDERAEQVFGTGDGERFAEDGAECGEKRRGVGIRMEQKKKKKREAMEGGEHRES